MDQRLNVKAKTVLLRKCGVNIHDFGLRNGFLDMTSKQSNNNKINEFPQN